MPTFLNVPLAAPFPNVLSLGSSAAESLSNMNQTPIFWAAFWAGLAGPASLYAPASTYYSYLGGTSVAQSFGSVALSLDRATGVYWNVRKPPPESIEHSAA